ncbi:MAG: response regulator [Planctomycetota bacterium]
MSHRLLIVEDSPLLRATACRAAVQAGVAPECVRQAGDGAQALALLAFEPADLVLLDLNLSVMDSYQFLEQMAAIPALASVKVALVTAEGNTKRLARLLQLGVVHYLRKPLEPEDLRALLRSLFATT